MPLPASLDCRQPHRPLTPADLFQILAWGPLTGLTVGFLRPILLLVVG